MRPSGSTNCTVMSGSRSPSSESELMLGLLKAVHENDQSTQRVLAKQVGMALGLVNTYLKRCIKKGYVKLYRGLCPTFFLSPNESIDEKII